MHPNGSYNWTSLSSAVDAQPDDLAFRAIRAILDTWPTPETFAEALQFAAEKLVGWPIAARTVELSDHACDIDYETTLTLLRSPSWPLVRGLLMADPQSVVDNFDLFSTRNLEKLVFRYGRGDLLSYCNIGNAHPGLSVISVNQFPLTAQVMTFLEMLPHGVAELSVGDIRDIEVGKKFLAFIASPKCANLKTLHIRYASRSITETILANPPRNLEAFSSAGLELLAIVGTPYSSQLVSLDLSGDAAAAEQLRSIPSSVPFAKLENLFLSQCRLDSDIAHHIFASPLFKSLKVLNVSANSLQSHGLSVLLSGSGSKIEILNLNKCEISLPELHGCSFGNYGPLLTELSLRSNNLGDKAAASLFSGGDLDHLQALDISDCGIGDNAVRAIGLSARKASLSSLIISKNNLSDVGLNAIASLPCFANLRVLAIDHNDVSEVGIQALAGSSKLTGLIGLVIGGPHLRQLHPRTIAALAASRCLSSLRWIRLVGPAFTDAAIMELCDAPQGWSQLRELTIDMGSVADSGLSKMSKSNIFRNLWSLSIIRNSVPIGLAGILPLGLPSACFGLAELNIDNVQAGDKLDASLSNVDVFRHLDRANIGVLGTLLLEAKTLRPCLRFYLGDSPLGTNC